MPEMTAGTGIPGVVMADLTFAELHCVTNYSFLRGASHPFEMVIRAQELGYSAIAITDECSVAGIVKAYQAIQDHNLSIQLIIGSEFQFDDQTLLLLATNLNGYSQICQLITKGRRRAEKGSYLLTVQDFAQDLDHCLCLWSPKPLMPSERIKQNIKQYGDWFSGRFWVLIENMLDSDSHYRQQQIMQIAQAENCPVTCGNNVHMHIPQRKMLQDSLTAIRHKTDLEHAHNWLFPNAENHLRSLKKIASIYTKEMINETLKIASLCQFSLSEITYRYPKDTLPDMFSAPAYLKKLGYDGALKRYPNGIPQKIDQNLKKELAVIAELGFEHYFLTIYDIVRFARSVNILCQGRGSAANSTLCYCLFITEVNPVEVNLLFERFMSTARNEPPDIDVDFEHERREEVIQYIYKTYGRDRAALTATVITYRRKTALRDIGRVLGIDPARLEQVISTYGWRFHTENWMEEMFSPLEGVSTEKIDQMKFLISEILGFPRHLSQHVGGFVITEGPISNLVPVENASMQDRTVIQWDKNDLQTMKLMKMDVLALGMLSAVRKTLDLIKKFQHQHVRIQDIDRSDAKVFEMIQQADTVGVFQIESRAQMNMLPRLKPSCFYDLVVQVAIVRPGPIHGDMVHPYLRRRNGQEAVDYPNELLKPVLERTYGVPIFQEQVIQLAMVAAGFSAGEADQLRRSMASWKKTGHISVLRHKLTENMKNNGYPDDYIERINHQIEGFGEYGFPESHAASFALIAYVSSWLKYHYPAAFCCSLMNSQPMGFYTNSQLVQDIRRHGVEVLPVEVNKSVWDHQLEGSKTSPAIRLGFRLVDQLSRSGVEALLEYRNHQKITHMEQLETIGGLKKADLESLASARAFETIEGNRYRSRWATAALNIESPLLQGSYGHSETDLPAPDVWETFREDQQSFGLTLGEHPIAILRHQGELPETIRADQLLGVAHKTWVDIVGLVVNRQRPKTAAGVTFLTLEDETGNINVVVWLAVAQKFLKEITAAHLLAIRGVVEKDEQSQVVHVIAHQVKELSTLIDLGRIGSRDFH